MTIEITTELWEHQIQMSIFVQEQLLSHGYAWLLAGMGVGKTLVAYDVARRLDVKKMLVLTTKAAATSAWIEDANEHTNGLVVVAPVGVPKHDKIDALGCISGGGVYVMNYESAWRMADELKDFGFDMVVADESHKLKSHNSKQSLVLAKMCMGIKYALAMTGTGWDDRPTDVYGQVRWLDPYIKRGRPYSRHLGTWTQFFERYVNYYQKDNIKFIQSYKNQDELRDTIDSFTMYVDSDDVLELPEALHINRDLYMTKAQRTAYNRMKTDMVVEFGQDIVVANNTLEASLRLHQITSGYLPNVEIMPAKDNPKLQETLAIIDELDDKPVVIFTRFTQDVELLKRHIQHAGHQVRLLTGDRHEHVAWQKGEGQILIANIQAGSAGVNLTRARYVIYYSVGHSRTDYNQSLRRVRRPGADVTKPVTYYHLRMHNSIDQLIAKAQVGKGEVSDYLLKGLTNRIL